MLIEVVILPGKPQKERGDLLERLAAEFLSTQQYEVTSQVRLTGSELDLLCKHKFNGQRVYVECKAQQDPLGAGVLKALVGTVTLKNYEEGWLVSTGPLGKDAKGIQAEWETKDASERRKLTIFPPERVLEALANSSIIVRAPEDRAKELVGSASLGEWTLLISEFGRHWCVTELDAGVPTKVRAFDAENGRPISDAQLLANIGRTDSSLAKLIFEPALAQTDKLNAPSRAPVTIIEVKHGESWRDYRPARPEHFVGRAEAQKEVIRFLDASRVGDSQTRVFAVTGDTGMGKSSLVIKLRSRLQNIRHRQKYFLFAVDMRAATGPEYVLAALLRCLQSAADVGFGNPPTEALKITSHADPLSSPTIRDYLATLKSRNQVVCLVLDQFEELYSKPDLFPVFKEAERLFLSCAAAVSQLVIGFVLRSDAMVQQDHPAYHLWHRLSDHRYEIGLKRFSFTEVAASLTLFEKELGQGLLPELRRQIGENCGGYPWLLKKLCIHLFEQLRSGSRQAELDETMDVETLFANDLNGCSTAERNCIQTIARQSPADWFEVLDAYGAETLRALQDRRLIIRNGDRLNLYWDIFREYVLSQSVRSIPFTYLCSSPSIGTFLTVASRLNTEKSLSCNELSSMTELSAKTISNVIHDLAMLGVATGKPASVKLGPRVQSGDPIHVLERVRAVMKRHALVRWLGQFPEASRIQLSDIIAGLQAINPTARHSRETWQIYAERIVPWLVAAGQLENVQGGWIARDLGKAFVPSRRGRLRGGAFRAQAPPLRAVQALEWLGKSPRSSAEVQRGLFRNAVNVLQQLELATRDDDGNYSAIYIVNDSVTAERLIWQASAQEEVIAVVRTFLESNPSARGRDVARHVETITGEDWSDASRQRTGSALIAWACWAGAETRDGKIPPPPGPRVRREMADAQDPQLFSSAGTTSLEDQRG